MSKLYVVATPIGNLKDITLRALEVLKEVDIVVAEDTRVTKKLLAHFDIHKPVIAYHKFSLQKTEEQIVRLLEDGKNIALVTDAGTPGISDPGYWLNSKIVKWLQNNHTTTQPLNHSTIQLIPIPGPSSVAAMISVADIDCSEFTFLGFPPHKKGRKTFFARVAKMDMPVILFESPHRIQKTLHELEIAAGNRYCNIGRELTKVYEEIFRGTLSDAQKYFMGEKQRGEFVIMLDVI